jgi:hypothetical protein
MLLSYSLDVMALRPWKESMRNTMSYWKIWCRTLGDKISDVKHEADTAAVLRTLWVTLQVLTCLAIIANVIHHW